MVSNNFLQQIIMQEAEALMLLASNLPKDLPKLIEIIIKTQGRVVLTGIGKSGHIARKIASSFASTGTASFYIHPAEASHGDLGMVTAEDIVIMLSKSGETKELYDLINYCKNLGIKIVAITMNSDSNLAKNSDILLNIPAIPEVSKLSVPTTSAIMMLALGDAIVISVYEAMGFTKDDYFKFHPGGKIGDDLLKNRENL